MTGRSCSLVASQLGPKVALIPLFVAHAHADPQAKIFLPQMNADERR